MPNRTLCDVLEAMRTCQKTQNYSYLSGLIEEAQQMAYRMEASLWDQKDIERMREDKKELKRELKKLKAKKEGLEDGK